MPADIIAFFDRYRDAFNSLDGSAVADLYAVPSAIAQGGEFTYWPAREPIQVNMDELCSVYRERGYAGATYLPVAHVAQGERYAIADLQWRIDWTNGQEPWVFRTTYNLVRTESGWRVLVCTAYSEDKLHSASSGEA